MVPASSISSNCPALVKRKRKKAHMRLELPWINCSDFGKGHFYSWSLTKLEIKIWKGGKWQISLSKFRNRKASYKYLKADITCLSTHWNSECYFVENLSKLSAIFWYTLFFLTTFLIFDYMCRNNESVQASMVTGVCFCFRTCCLNMTMWTSWQLWSWF